ncbi:hypothetical protein NM688_g8406 [Phlebia brevispora]|uniref:Uncharacterized protein n=1 Tax=Phlebia brevispora TaxID=194682 RepID=A0ACC1RT36_9APHY|nr:hypothetical protein NM688_g8406 [Phlebia brevispora]
MRPSSKLRAYRDGVQADGKARLEVPTLTDPAILGPLQESDLSVSYFGSLSSSGFLSQFDFIQIISLSAGLVSHVL